MNESIWFCNSPQFAEGGVLLVVVDGHIVGLDESSVNAKGDALVINFLLGIPRRGINIQCWIFEQI